MNRNTFDFFSYILIYGNQKIFINVSLVPVRHTSIENTSVNRKIILLLKLQNTETKYLTVQKLFNIFRSLFYFKNTILHLNSPSHLRNKTF